MNTLNAINVKTDFGAVADGLADDAPLLQATLDACRDTGGTVFFPVGTYRINTCLLYYSNQRLIFENGAVLLRGGANQMYLLGNHTEPDKGGYNATCNVDIIGATFDGNADIDFKATLLNNSHSRDLRIKNCKFRNGHTWHYYECNSSEYVTVENCVFEHSMKGTDKSEFIQLDWATKGAYATTDICADQTVCRHILITNCKFECDGFSPAIGNHTPAAHHHIRICNNTFLGGAGSRGYICLVEPADKADVYNNTFIGGETGVSIGGSGGASSLHDNRFEGVERPWDHHPITYNNIVDGRLNASFRAASRV